jgi:hypothetical protein
MCKSPKKIELMETLNNNFFMGHANTNDHIIQTPLNSFLSKKNGGLPIPNFTEIQQPLKNALMSTSLHLIKSFHTAGWIHGDSHLGNFMIDVKTMRMYVIDLERCHNCTCSVQQFLDTQEMFGHACGLLLDICCRGKWDMTDVQGVATQMHPYLVKELEYNATDTIFMMLPVCTCFIKADIHDKQKGCMYCKSKVNVLSAKFYRNEKGFTSLINSLERTSFEYISSVILQTRMNMRLKEKQALYILSSNSDFFFQSYKLWDNVNYDIADAEERDEIDAMREAQVKQLLYNGAFYPSFLEKSIAVFTTLLWYHKIEETISLLQCLVCPTSRMQDMIQQILHGPTSCHEDPIETFEKK